MIYLNNSASSFPKPKQVLDEVYDNISCMPLHSSRMGYDTQQTNKVEETRKLLADFFSLSSPEQLIFTSGATESLNLAIKGIISKGEHVITTSIDHNSVLRPLKTLENEGVIELDIVHADNNGFINPEDVKQSLRQNSKLIVISHASNVTGTIQDIKTITEIAHNAGVIVLVDISQSAGQVNIDFENLDIDMAAFTGHKSLYGIQGIGGLLLRSNIKLTPLKVGGTGIKSDYLFQPEELPVFYEAGTLNIPGIVSLKAGVEYIKEHDINRLRIHREELITRLDNELNKIRNVLIVGRSNKIEQLPVLNIIVKNIDISDVAYILENSYNIIIRSGLHCAPLIHKDIGTFPDGTIRVSPSSFSTEKEVDAFVEAIKDISKIA